MESPVTKVKINNINSLAYWYSGSNISVISYNHFSKLSETDHFKRKIKPANKNATGITGETLDIMGKVLLHLIIGKARFVHEIYILDNTKFIGDILTGRDIIKRIGTVSFNFGEKYIRVNKERLPIVCSDGYKIQCLKISKEEIYKDELRIEKKINLPPHSFVKTFENV